MKIRAARRLAFLLAVLPVLVCILLGCGNKSEEKTDPSDLTLDGKWGGTWGDYTSALRTFSFEILGETVSNVKFDGEVQEGLDGSVAAAGENLYAVTLGDGSEYLFITGTSKRFAYLVLRDPNLAFAVVQKNASGPASSYVQADYASDWEGRTLELDAGFEVASSGEGGLSIDRSGDFTGYDSLDSLTGRFETWDPDFGAIAGGLEGSEGYIVGVLSQSKNFFGFFACEGEYPVGCTFGTFTRQ